MHGKAPESRFFGKTPADHSAKEQRAPEQAKEFNFDDFTDILGLGDSPKVWG